MKKIFILSLILISTAGCGQGWLPLRPFRGAPCGGAPGCMSAAPNLLPHGCPCPTTAAGYPSYEGAIMGEEVIGSSYLGGEIIHDGIVASPNGVQGRGPSVAPPMGSIRGN